MKRQRRSWELPKPKRKKATTSAEKQKLLDKVRFWVIYCHTGWTIYSWSIQALSRKWQVKEGEIEHCLSLLNKEGLISRKLNPLFAADRRPNEWHKFCKCEELAGFKYRM